MLVRALALYFLPYLNICHKSFTGFGLWLIIFIFPETETAQFDGGF